MPEPMTIHTGTTVPLDYTDVDTDQIVPAEYCRRITKSGYEDALFANWRRDPNFIFNHPDRAGASVLIAGSGFGIGSSREHAVWALRDWGVVAVIAPSFGDIFRSNATKNGMLPVVLSAGAVRDLLSRSEADPKSTVTVDLTTQQVRADGRSWDFQFDEQARWMLIHGYDDIDLALTRQRVIAAYEQERRPWLPKLPAPNAKTVA